MSDQMTALAYNVRLRNGRRELPRERPAQTNLLETLAHITIYAVIVAVIAVVLFFAFSIADRQMALEDRTNQENVHVR